jgi:hypothetical protein
MPNLLYTQVVPQIHSDSIHSISFIDNYGLVRLNVSNANILASLIKTQAFSHHLARRKIYIYMTKWGK